MKSNNAAPDEQQEQLDTDPIITDDEEKQSNLAFLLDETIADAIEGMSAQEATASIAIILEAGEIINEHNVWAPKKVKGRKLYERVEAKGQMGYVGGRRLKGGFSIKDLSTGKILLEMTPRTLVQRTRPRHNWIIAEYPCERKEERASSFV